MSIITAAQSGPNIPAFLNLLAWSEATSKASGSRSAALSVNDGYDVIVAGVDGPEVFTDYSDHPFAHRKAKLIRASVGTKDALFSTASGRYQVLCRFFEVYRVTLHLPDFGPLSQDLVAIQQMRERGSLPHLESGNIEAAIKAHLPPVDLEAAISEDASVWASLPGNSYGQGGHTMEALLAQWELRAEAA